MKQRCRTNPLNFEISNRLRNVPVGVLSNLEGDENKWDCLSISYLTPALFCHGI